MNIAHTVGEIVAKAVSDWLITLKQGSIPLDEYFQDERAFCQLEGLIEGVTIRAFREAQNQGTPMPTDRKQVLVLTVKHLAFTQEHLAAAFTEWKRRWTESPDSFEKMDDSWTGEQCADYLLEILHEQNPPRDMHEGPSNDVPHAY